MRIGNLPHRVSSVKGHWTPVFPDRSAAAKNDGWVGFTPSKDAAASRGQLRSTVGRQMGHGYVLEYVSISQPNPNPNSPRLTPEERELHAKAAGSLTAVFKLGNRPAHTREYIGDKEYGDIQDRWDQQGHRVRWSEAYPIIEAWEITGWPKARDVLGLEAAARRCEMLAQGLKVLDDDDRAKLAHLDIVPIDLPADGLAARYFVELAQQNNELNGVPRAALTHEGRLLSEDYSAVEGMPKDTRSRRAQRDQHLVKILKQNGPLKCSICSYDPIIRGATPRQARAILEAHHFRIPLCAGVRLSNVTDLILLCPTCHREVHQGLAATNHAAN
jgi:5-methylcytosine-specific restriction enzyme A